MVICLLIMVYTYKQESIYTSYKHINKNTINIKYIHIRQIAFKNAQEEQGNE